MDARVAVMTGPNPFQALCLASAAGRFPACDRMKRTGEISAGRGLVLLSRRGKCFGIRALDVCDVPVRPGVASGVVAPGQPGVAG